MKQDLKNINQILQQGIALHKEGKLEEAETSYKKAIELKSNNMIAHNNLGVVQYELGKYKEAETSYKKAIEHKPDFAEAYYNLGATQIKTEKYQEAEESYQKAIEINPDYAEAYYDLGNMLKDLGRLLEAEVNYKKVIELKADFILAYNNLGVIQHELGKLDEAEDNFKKSIALKPDFTDAHYNLGVLLFECKKYKNAVEHFTLSNSAIGKSFLLKCWFHLDEQTLFYEQLDYLIKRGDNNALIGALVSSSEIRYGINKPNPFCNNPLDYILHNNLAGSCNFETIFVQGTTDILVNDKVKHKSQGSLTDVIQTTGNVFSQGGPAIDEIQKILRLEIEKYRTHFKDSNEDFLKNWPSKYDLNGWLIKMKSGGSLSAHMHENGWVSGSVYINVPPKSKTDSGNLIVCMDDNENNLGENKKSINVVTGSLCLFPSSLYHYTIPFESNEERIVLAFDVIPK